MTTTTENNEKDVQIVLPVSLRDYFAAAALQGWIARGVDSNTFQDDVARWAYIHADAMIRERAK